MTIFVEAYTIIYTNALIIQRQDIYLKLLALSLSLNFFTYIRRLTGGLYRAAQKENVLRGLQKLQMKFRDFITDENVPLRLNRCLVSLPEFECVTLRTHREQSAESIYYFSGALHSYVDLTEPRQGTLLKQNFPAVLDGAPAFAVCELVGVYHLPEPLLKMIIAALRASKIRIETLSIGQAFICLERGVRLALQLIFTCEFHALRSLQLSDGGFRMSVLFRASHRRLGSPNETSSAIQNLTGLQKLTIDGMIPDPGRWRGRALQLRLILDLKLPNLHELCLAHLLLNVNGLMPQACGVQTNGCPSLQSVRLNNLESRINGPEPNGHELYRALYELRQRNLTTFNIQHVRVSYGSLHERKCAYFLYGDEPDHIREEVHGFVKGINSWTKELTSYFNFSDQLQTPPYEN